MVLFRGDIKCKSLQRRTSISVILPADNIHFLQDTEEIVPKPYRTLYLLHGLYGSDDIFLANTSIQKFAEDNGIAIVIPCGENSFYRNQGEGRNYSNFIGQELLTITRNMFNLSRKREDTFIGGYSMGAYGALYNGLKYHHNFSKIVGLSPVLKLDYSVNKSTKPSSHYSLSFLENCFGSLENMDINEINPEYLLKNLIANDKRVPDIYLSCAEDDEILINPTRKFKEVLNKYKDNVNYTYSEGRGGHNWQYWDRQLESIINWIVK